MQLLAILVTVVGLLGSLLTYLGKMHAGSLNMWAIIALVGIVATIFTRRAAD